MQTFFYCRDDLCGAREYSPTPFSKPHPADGGVGYFVQNMGLEDSGSIIFRHVGMERSVPLRTIAGRRSFSLILHYVTDGYGIYNGRRMGPGDGFAVFPEQLHTMQADVDEPWHFCWMSIIGSDLYALLQSVGVDAEHPFFTFSYGERVKEIFEDLVFAEHTDTDLSMYLISALYRLLALQRHAYLQGGNNNDVRFAGVRQAMAIMDESYGSDLRIENLAEQVHLSRKYFCRLFQECCGISPKEYLLRKRLTEAMRLLSQTDLSVVQIAAAVGYADYTQLSRLFQSKLGISPRQYRSRSINME